MPFVALSYCLGIVQLNVTVRASENGLFLDMVSLPQTIRDAILVTTRLRRRYLWVDAISIPQEDIPRKKELINEMDRIYTHADIVLVALGEDVHSGLHGVSAPRTSQPVLKLGDRTLVSNMSDLREVLQKSRYSTRCWTYQEAILARRCIFFTPEQWHFVCQQSSAYEILTEPLPRRVGLRADIHALRPTLFRLRGTSKHDLEITEDVREYTVRDLLLDSDFLNAFNGVLRRSNLFSLRGVVSLPQGDPLSVASLERGFAFGLFWMGQDRSFARTEGTPRTSRRPGFPTWSWLSSRGVVDMTWSNPRDFVSDFSGVDIHASFSLKNGESSKPLTSFWLATPDHDIGSNALGLKDGQDLQITSYLMKVRFIRPTQPVMLAEYWLDLDRPFALLDEEGSKAVYAASLQFAAGEHRPIEDHDNIVFDKEAFSDTTLQERILTEEFELLLLVSHAFQGRQLNYWLILDQDGKSRKRIGTVRCIGNRYERNHPKQQGESHPPLSKLSMALIHRKYALLSKTTVTMV
ncbi:hypothetical protein H2200_008811 [Cladophialophora chaetospira]|uniref:Heterokaryon incompatibility domain-containing protein n=1 Tax=Cladophialophora chaetospira TaxID=386627 RepID=A0AA38X4S5_9EURO|nr:hypothetical protein H2200_008811 [Cladophialophora chaetospira]